MKTIILTFKYNFDQRKILGDFLDNIFPQKNTNYYLSTVGNYVYHSAHRDEVCGEKNSLYYIGHTDNFTRRFREHNGLISHPACKWKRIQKVLKEEEYICLSLIVDPSEVIGQYSNYYDFEFEKLAYEDYECYSREKKDLIIKELDFSVKVEQSFLVEGSLLRVFNEIAKNENKNYKKFLWNGNLASKKVLKFLKNVKEDVLRGMGKHTLKAIAKNIKPKSEMSDIYFFDDFSANGISNMREEINSIL